MSVSATVNIIIVLSRFLRQQNKTVIFYINFRLNRDNGLALPVHSNPLSKCSAAGFLRVRVEQTCSDIKKEVLLQKFNFCRASLSIYIYHSNLKISINGFTCLS